MTRMGWEPTTEAEVALYEALLAGDQERYFRVLTRAELLLPVSADAMAGRAPMGWATWTSNDHTHLLAFTSVVSMRTCLAEHAGAARRMALADLASVWPNHEWWLAINPGLPIEGYLPAWFVAQLSRGDARLPGQSAPSASPSSTSASSGSVSGGSGPRDRLARVEALERAKAARAAGHQGPSDNREPVRVSATVGPRALPSAPPPPPNQVYPPQAPWIEPAPEIYPPQGRREPAGGSGWGSAAPPWQEDPRRDPAAGGWQQPAQAPWVDDPYQGGLPRRPVATPRQEQPRRDAAAPPGTWQEPAPYFVPTGYPPPAVYQGPPPSQPWQETGATPPPGMPSQPRRPEVYAQQPPPAGWQDRATPPWAQQGSPWRGPAAPPAGQWAEAVPPGQWRDPAQQWNQAGAPAQQPAAWDEATVTRGVPPNQPGVWQQSNARHSAPQPAASWEEATVLRGQPHATGTGAPAQPGSIWDPQGASTQQRQQEAQATAMGSTGQTGQAQPGSVWGQAQQKAWDESRGAAAQPTGATQTPAAQAMGATAAAMVGARQAAAAAAGQTATDAAAPRRGASWREATAAADARPANAVRGEAATATRADTPADRAEADWWETRTHGVSGSGPSQDEPPGGWWEKPGAGEEQSTTKAAEAVAPPQKSGQKQPSAAPTEKLEGKQDKASEGATDSGFVPANPVEAELLDAAQAGNTDAFLSTLLLATVLIPKASGTTNGKWRPQPIDGEPHLICYTSTQHLAEQLETVSIKFIKLINEWPDPTWSFAVNPGTPVGATLPGGQLMALANWAAEVGLGGDDDEAEAPKAETKEPAPSAAKAPPPVAGRASPELTVLQKAIAPSQVSYYLERGYDRVSGFVHRAHEVGHLNGIDEMRRALGLDWPGSPFKADATEIYLLRWAAYRPNLFRIPYGGRDEAGMKAMQGWVIERPPFRGNGFAPGESKEIIAEFKVDSARLPHGARLVRMYQDGREELIAELDADGQRWVPRMGAADA